MDKDKKVADAVATIFGELSDRHAEMFEALCRDAHLVKVCPQCNWNIAINENVCGGCGEPYNS